MYFYQSQWGWPSNVGQYTNAVNVDGSNWVQCSLAHPIPPGTRWVIFQIGFTDDTLLGRSGYADCVQMEVLTDGGSPVPVTTTTWGRVKGMYK